MDLSDILARFAAAAQEYHRTLTARLARMARDVLESLPIPSQGDFLPVLETAVEFGSASVLRGPAQETLAILSRHYRRPAAAAPHSPAAAAAAPRVRSKGTANPSAAGEDHRKFLRQLHRLRRT